MRSLSVAAPHAARGGDLPHPGERWPTSASDGKPIGAGNKSHFAMLGNCAATIALGNKFPKLVDPRALAPAVAEAIGSFVLTVTSVSSPGRTTSNRQKPTQCYRRIVATLGLPGAYQCYDRAAAQFV
jgi:hypothetical protein